MEKQIEAVVAGNIYLDITPRFNPAGSHDFKELFSPGKTHMVTGTTFSLGGAAAKTGTALKILGIETELDTQLGDDMTGQMIQTITNHYGMKGIKIVPGATSPVSVIMAPPGIDRMFFLNAELNHTYGWDCVDYDRVARAKLFHFGYPASIRRMFEGGAVEMKKLYQMAKETGVTTSLDTNMGDVYGDAGRADWGEILSSSLPYIDIFIPSLEETVFLFEREEFFRLNKEYPDKDKVDIIDINIVRDLADRILAMGPKIAGIKCGKKGLYIKTKDSLEGLGRAVPADLDNWSGRELMQQTFHVDHIASATGAGDTCYAGFLAAMLRGYSIEDAMKIGCATASGVIQTYDGLSGVLPIEQVYKKIKGGWQMDPSNMDPRFFSWNEAEGIWIGSQDRTVRG